MQSVLSLLGTTAPHADRRRGALLSPPTGPGSIGDEAMLMGLASELATRGEGPVQVLARGGASRWHAIPDATLLDFPSGIAKVPVLLQAFRRVKRVFVVGADCLDGHYSVPTSVNLIRMADAAGRMRALSTIVGSSFRETPAPETVAALKALSPGVRLCARDPRSAERMRRLSGRACDLVADAAFILRPTPPTDSSLIEEVLWVSKRRESGRIVVGVNFNRQVLGKGPSAEAVESLMFAFQHAIQHLTSTRPDVDVVLIPHDYRGEDSDLTQAIVLWTRLSMPERVGVLRGSYRASELKYVAGLCDMVLTGRMHLAIAALGGGVPVACVTYQGKFEGLFDHFQMKPVVLSPDAVTQDSLSSMLVDAVDRREELKRDVLNRLDKVRELSLSNLGSGANSPTHG